MSNIRIVRASECPGGPRSVQVSKCPSVRMSKSTPRLVDCWRIDLECSSCALTVGAGVHVDQLGRSRYFRCPSVRISRTRIVRASECPGDPRSIRMSKDPGRPNVQVDVWVGRLLAHRPQMFKLRAYNLRWRTCRSASASESPSTPESSRAVGEGCKCPTTLLSDGPECLNVVRHLLQRARVSNLHIVARIPERPSVKNSECPIAQGSTC